MTRRQNSLVPKHSNILLSPLNAASFQARSGPRTLTTSMRSLPARSTSFPLFPSHPTLPTPFLPAPSTHAQSYFFHMSMHENGVGQMTLAHGSLEGQSILRLRSRVDWPHWVPFMAGGSGSWRPSRRMSSRQPGRVTQRGRMLGRARVHD